MIEKYIIICYHDNVRYRKDDMRKFTGFTLAELMIALAVIGILVAVVTPAIVKTRPNKNRIMVKKTFYTVENVVSSLINDERLYPDMRDGCYETPINATCAWGFDMEDKVTYEGVDYDGETKFPLLFATKLNVKSADDTNYIYYTNDGVKWDLSGTKDAWTSGKSKVGTFADASPDAGKGVISIDVNGDEEPNAFCTAANEDCDQYKVEILANGKLRIDPEHTRAIEYVTINTSMRDSI